MAFPADILRSGVAIVDSLTKGVQVNITHEAWVDQDGHGDPVLANPVTLRAVLDLNRKQQRQDDGTIITIMATVTIVGDVAPNGAAGRLEPIDPRDIITLPDGTTGPIIQTAPNSVVDPITGRGFIHEIVLAAG